MAISCILPPLPLRAKPDPAWLCLPAIQKIRISTWTALSLLSGLRYQCYLDCVTITVSTALPVLCGLQFKLLPGLRHIYYVHCNSNCHLDCINTIALTKCHALCPARSGRATHSHITIATPDVATSPAGVTWLCLPDRPWSKEQR